MLSAPPKRPSPGSQISGRPSSGILWGSDPCRPCAQLPGGKTRAPAVAGSVKHINALGVDMFGHLKNSIQLVLEGRLTRSRQSVVTRSQNNLGCIHNEYVYTPAPPARKCANLTITFAQRGDRLSPSGRRYGYLQWLPWPRARPSSAICNKTGGGMDQSRTLPRWRACRIAR